MTETRFYDFFQDRVKANKSRLLFQKRDGWSWKQITWLDFNTQVNSIAAFMLDCGFTKESRVLIISPNTLERLFVESSLFLLGCCSVSAPSIVQVENIGEILNKEKINFVFVSNEDVLSRFKEVLESNKAIEKIFLFSKNSPGLHDKIVDYKSVVKFGFLKARKLKDELTEVFISVNPDTPAINFYSFNNEKMESKIITQKLLLNLLRLSCKELRFVTPEDSSFSYLASQGSFSELANFLPIFIGNRGAIAENKMDFLNDVLEVMPTVLFLSSEGIEWAVKCFSEQNGTVSLKEFFGGRLKYLFTDRDPEYKIKSSLIRDGISVIDLPELTVFSQ